LKEVVALAVRARVGRGFAGRDGEGNAVITNDAELEVVRKQLQRAEAALEACRRDFLPHNEVQYRLFAGSTIDLIQSLRAEIDAYLGIGLDTDLAVSLDRGSVRREG
jgi:hypothetical protein